MKGLETKRKGLRNKESEMKYEQQLYTNEAISSTASVNTFYSSFISIKSSLLSNTRDIHGRIRTSRGCIQNYLDEGENTLSPPLAPQSNRYHQLS